MGATKMDFIAHGLTSSLSVSFVQSHPHESPLLPNVCRHWVDLYFLYRTILAVQMGAMMAGQISALTPDYLKAKAAAGRLFKLFDRVPVIQSDSKEGLQPVS